MTTGRRASDVQAVDPAAAAINGDLGGGVRVWRAGGGTDGYNASRRSWRRRQGGLDDGTTGVRRADGGTGGGRARRRSRQRRSRLAHREMGNRRLRRVKAILAAALDLGGGGREGLTTGRQTSSVQMVEPAAAARPGDIDGGVRVWRAGSGTGGCGATGRFWRRRSHPGKPAALQIDPSSLLRLHGIP